MLETPLEKIGYIIVKAREFDAEVGVSGTTAEGVAEDDEEHTVLEDYAGNPTYDELYAAIEGLNEDEQVELVALAWLGRGDYDKDEWDEIMDEARRERINSTADYLTGIPLLADYLEEGLELLGYSVEDAEE